MPKRIPIKVAKELAAQQDLRQVVILAWDGEKSHVVTYGRNVDESDRAARTGEQLRELLSWPESATKGPSRVEALRRQISDLEAEVQRLRALVPPPPYPRETIVDRGHQDYSTMYSDFGPK